MGQRCSARRRSCKRRRRRRQCCTWTRRRLRTSDRRPSFLSRLRRRSEPWMGDLCAERGYSDVMKASDVSTTIRRIGEALSALRTAGPAEKARWKIGPRRSEAEIRAVERTLGFALPVGYRAYLREIGDGGAGLHDEMKLRSITKLSSKEVVRAKKAFPLEERWYSPAPDNVAFFERMGLYAKKRRFFVELPKGSEPTDGTLSLGVPLGTHEYYVLVLRGEHAGQVWVDATGEDGGGVEPLRKADFLEASLGYFRAKLAERKREGSIESAVARGEIRAILAKASGASLRERLDAVEVAVHDILRAPDPPVERCRGVAESSLIVAEIVDDDAFRVASQKRIATLAFLMAGDLERAHELARAGLEASRDPHVIENRFMTSHGLHLLLANAGLGRPVEKLPLPKRPDDYRTGHFNYEQILVTYRRLEDAARAAVRASVAPAWRAAFGP
ncbi:MAG: SMI1/KNR4 family protein [Labilithrix sp.]|nr:SMI1/KNR4 family protein [Labilithrix sp.]